MIETKPGEAWSTYTINDCVKVLLKHSTNPRKLRNQRGGLSWTFVLSRDQLKQLQVSRLYLALVCGQRLAKGKMEVCLLTPDEVAKLFDLSSDGQQSVTVKVIPERSLWVSSVKDEIVVSRNAVENWDIPGS